jgi:transposase|tara:strand:- start:137 stop:427 length:291 start_codon:yes stop_codon:yes gene_type:complete
MGKGGITPERRVLSGIIYVLKRGLQWRDAPSEYGPHKTIYNHFIRWSRMGVFEQIFKELSSQDVPEKLHNAALIILNVNQPTGSFKPWAFQDHHRF